MFAFGHIKKVFDYVDAGNMEMAHMCVESVEAELGVKLTSSEYKLLLSDRQSLKYLLARLFVFWFSFPQFLSAVHIHAFAQLMFLILSRTGALRPR